MPYQQVALTDKQRLFEAHNRGDDYVDLARQMGIKRTTAYAIIRRAQQHDEQVALQRGGARPQRQLVTPDLIDAAVQIVEQHPDYTLQQINRELRLALPHHAHIGRSTLSNMLHGQLIVMKKLEDAPLRRNAMDVKNARLNFAQWIMQDGVQMKMIFIDEAGINLWCKRTCGRAKRGERAVRVVGGVRGQNLTMTLAVSATNGVIHSNLRKGGMNGDRFCRFLEDVAAHLPRDNVGRVFILHNAPAHRLAQQARLPIMSLCGGYQHIHHF